MTTSTQIVEYATLSYRDGREVRYGRPKGRKTFFVEGEGECNPRGISFSRRSLTGRPKTAYHCTGVTFQKASDRAVV